MSADEKRFPPSELKLKRLRKEGVVPLSRDLLAGAAFLGLAGGVPLLVFDRGPDLLFFAREAFSHRAALPDSASALFAPLAGHLFALTACVLAPVLFLLFLLGGLQTRFLFTLRPLSISFSRLFSSINVLRGSGSRIGRSVAALFKAASVLALGVLLLYRLFSSLLTDVRISRVVSSAAAGFFPPEGGTPEAAAESLFRAIAFQAGPLMVLLLGLAAGAMFIGVLSWIFAFVAFRHEHGMTRGEVEAEYREMEVSPEIQRARKESFVS